MKRRPNPGRPLSKAKHYPMTDSERVPRGKGEKNPREGSETDLKSCVHKLWERLRTRPFAFCIMSPRVTVAGEPNREGRRSESESEQGETRVGRGGPEAHASYPWTA